MRGAGGTGRRRDRRAQRVHHARLLAQPRGDGAHGATAGDSPAISASSTTRGSSPSSGGARRSSAAAVEHLSGRDRACPRPPADPRGERWWDSDSALGEAVVAAVVLRDGATLGTADVVAHARQPRRLQEAASRLLPARVAAHGRLAAAQETVAAPAASAPGQQRAAASVEDQDRRCRHEGRWRCADLQQDGAEDAPAGKPPWATGAWWMGVRSSSLNTYLAVTGCWR